MEEKNVFAVQHKADGRVIGSFGLHPSWANGHPQYAALRQKEIGYVLSKAYWGQGLMPEAVKAVIDWLFRDMQLDFIICGHFDWNSRSRRVIEKCGFRYVKTVEFKTRIGTVENAMDYILYHPERGDITC